MKTLTIAIYALAMVILSVDLNAALGTLEGPPNRLSNDKNTNRTSIRSPLSPSNQSQVRSGSNKPIIVMAVTSSAIDFWAMVFDLDPADDEDRVILNKFTAELKRYKDRLREIANDNRLNTERKMEAREKARELRNRKLSGILDTTQFQAYLTAIRQQGRPGKGKGQPDVDKPDSANSITRQQRAKMAKLMRWFREEVRQIQRTDLSNQDKKNKIDDLKNAYRQKRSGILSTEQAVAWASIDGIPPSTQPLVVAGFSVEEGFPSGNPSPEPGSN